MLFSLGFLMVSNEEGKRKIHENKWTKWTK